MFLALEAASSERAPVLDHDSLRLMHCHVAATSAVSSLPLSGGGKDVAAPI
jgi:hypothetical protein